MPLSGPSKLSILTFPQRWEPNNLLVRFLCLPKISPPNISPLDPLVAGQPAFAEADLVFEANVISGLDHLPKAADATGLGALVLNDPPINKEALFNELKEQFNITPRISGAVTAPCRLWESFCVPQSRRAPNPVSAVSPWIVIVHVSP